MKKQFGTALVLSVLVLPLGCTSTATSVADSGGAGGAGPGGTGGATTPGGTGGSGTGGATGSGGGGGLGSGSGGTTTAGGSGGNAADAATDAADAAGDGSEADAPVDAALETAPDDGTFPASGPVGSCDPLNWMVSASSSSPNDPPGGAIDGVLSTRWSTGAGQANGQYFELDFGGFVRLSEITLDNTGSPGDHPRGYEVRTSRDDADFSTVIASGMPGDALPVNNLVTIDFPARAVRFLRIQMTGLSGSWWSIHNLTVACQIPGPGGTWTTDKPSSVGLCGPGTSGQPDGGAADGATDVPADGSAAETGAHDGGAAETGVHDGGAAETAAPDATAPNPFDHTQWKVTASNTSGNPADAIGNAIDGDIATRWSSGRAQTGNEFFKVDLGSVGCVSQLRIVSSAGDFAASYVVNVSTDDETYIRVAKGTGSNVMAIVFAPRLARYVRIDQTGTSGSWWSIDELTILP